MPRSAAPFTTRTLNLFLPAGPANVLSGTTTVSSGTPGNYGVALGNSATVKLQFQIPGLQEPAENYPPYEQYNAPLTHSIKQNYLTVYYTVAGATLTSMTLGLYATNYPGGAAGTVTVLLANANNGLTLPVGTYAVAIPLKNLPAITLPFTTVVAELDIATGASGTAVINGIGLS